MTTAASNEEGANDTQAEAYRFPAWYWAYEGGVNIRTEPDVNATSVGHLQEGERIQVTKVAILGGNYGPVCNSTIDGNKWWPVHYSGQTRYVAMPCLIRMDA